MAPRFIDFDAARVERSREPLILRAYGREFALPAAMPAALLLDIVRMQEEQGSDAELSGRDAVRLMTMVVPADVLDELLDRDDFSTDDFVELARLVVQAYTSGDEATAGEAPAPNRAQRRTKSARSRGSLATSTSRTETSASGRESSSTGD